MTERKADLIFMSDPHIREDVPVCRTDDYISTQWKKWDFISKLQKETGATILCAGDLFNHWKPSPNLIRETMIHLPSYFYTIFGQHDLPQHNFELRNKSGIAVLEQSGDLRILSGTHFGMEPSKDAGKASWYEGRAGGGRTILVWHKLVWQGKRPWPGCTDPNADEVMDRYPEYDVILTGDNHKPFVVNKNGRLLVNPGSLMRMAADQIDHKPRVYLYYGDTNEVEPVYIPIRKDAVSREHIEAEQERDSRIEAFISKLGDNWELGMSFEQNLKAFQQENNIQPEVMKVIYSAMEDSL
jgi:DNA repair exonuclease SbcCD nuclease subunit